MRRTKQEVVTEFRRSEILDAARKVFARKGFDGATVDDIAETAGIAKGTLYLYFSSKNEIQREVLLKGMSKLMAATRQSVDEAPTFVAKVKALITTRIQFADEHEDLIRIYHSQSASGRTAYLDKERSNLYLNQVKMLEEVLGEAAAQGQIRCARTDAAAVAVLEMIRGFIIHRILGAAKPSAKEDADLLFDLIWRGLAP